MHVNEAFSFGRKRKTNMQIEIIGLALIEIKLHTGGIYLTSGSNLRLL